MIIIQKYSEKIFYDFFSLPCFYLLRFFGDCCLEFWIYFSFKVKKLFHTTLQIHQEVFFYNVSGPFCFMSLQVILFIWVFKVFHLVFYLESLRYLTSPNLLNGLRQSWKWGIEGVNVVGLGIFWGPYNIQIDLGTVN